MADHSIYRDIAERTGGDIYIGVVGPVRSGKSTFIKRFMESLVLPNMGEGYSRERARDERPQSAAGKTVMTTEPKFIPDEAVTIRLDGAANMRVKMIDCVGYIVPEALGTIENGQPRMVRSRQKRGLCTRKLGVYQGVRRVDHLVLRASRAVLRSE